MYEDRRDGTSWNEWIERSPHLSVHQRISETVTKPKEILSAMEFKGGPSGLQDQKFKKTAMDLSSNSGNKNPGQAVIPFFSSRKVGKIRTQGGLRLTITIVWGKRALVKGSRRETDGG